VVDRRVHGVLAEDLQHARAPPERQHRRMDSRVPQRRPLGAELLGDLGEDVGAVGVGEVDRLGVEDDRRRAVADQLAQPRPEAIGVGEEERAMRRLRGLVPILRWLPSYDRTIIRSG
jgi:hypothetical protein